MSDTLLLSLNKDIPRNFLGRQLLFYTECREYPHEMCIENVSHDVLRFYYCDTGRGYDLRGRCYHIIKDNGVLFYRADYQGGKPYAMHCDERTKADYYIAYHWIHNNLMELIDLGYEVALMNGHMHPNDPEEIVDCRTLKAEELLKLDTVLEYNVLYTIVK